MLANTLAGLFGLRTSEMNSAAAERSVRNWIFDFVTKDAPTPTPIPSNGATNFLAGNTTPASAPTTSLAQLAQSLMVPVNDAAPVAVKPVQIKPLTTTPFSITPMRFEHMDKPSTIGPSAGFTRSVWPASPRAENLQPPQDLAAARAARALEARQRAFRNFLAAMEPTGSLASGELEEAKGLFSALQSSPTPQAGWTASDMLRVLESR